MATKYGPTIVTDGLVLCLDAGNSQSYPGSGTTWTDLMGNGNGAITNATYSSTDGGVITFDGANDYVIVDDDSSFLFANNTDITVEVWASKDQDNTNGHPILMHYNSVYDGSGGTYSPSVGLIAYGTSGNYSDFGFWVEADGDQDGYGGGADILASTRSHTPDPNGWAQHVGTYSGGTGSHTGKIYMDASLLGTNTTTHSSIWYKPTNPNNGGITLGSSGHNVGNSTHGFEGVMSIVRIYNKALSAAEILQNYNANKGRYGL